MPSLRDAVQRARAVHRRRVHREHEPGDHAEDHHACRARCRRSGRTRRCRRRSASSSVGDRRGAERAAEAERQQRVDQRRRTAPTRAAPSACRSPVSWYSGANVATTSIPYADQHMKYSQTRASGEAAARADLPRSCSSCDQSPVRYGRNMSTNGGDDQQPAGDVAEPHRRAHAEDVEEPDEQDQHAAEARSASVMSKPAPLWRPVVSENHSAWMSVPATSPLTASTTDQPIQ